VAANAGEAKLGPTRDQDSALRPPSNSTLDDPDQELSAKLWFVAYLFELGSVFSPCACLRTRVR